MKEKFKIGDQVVAVESVTGMSRLGIGVINDVEVHHGPGMTSHVEYFVHWGRSPVKHSKTMYYLENELELTEGYGDFQDKIDDRIG